MTGYRRPLAGSSALWGTWPRAVAWLILLPVGLVSPTLAGVCTVPGSHATIQEAIDDPSCTTINLSTQTYPESINITRTLTLAGPGGGGAIVEGLVRVVGKKSSPDGDRVLNHKDTKISTKKFNSVSGW